MGITIRKKPLKNGDQSLYLDYYHQGRRQYEFLKLYLTGDRKTDKEKEKLALIVKNQREIDLFSGIHGIIPEHRKHTSLVSFAKPIIEKKGRSNGAALLTYLERHFGSLELGGVNERSLSEFQDYLRHEASDGQGLMHSTVETYMNSLGAILNKAVREKYLLENPMKHVSRLRAEEPILEYLTIPELQVLSKTPIMGEAGFGGQIKRGFLFACQTALRWSDIRALTWGDILPDSGGLFQIRMRQQKTRQPVYIPLSKEAMKIIDDGQDVHPHTQKVFGIDSKTDSNQYLTRWGKAAGIQTNVHFHLSRHTAATLFLINGVPVEVVQKILGHKRIEQTLRYAKITDDLKRKAVDGLILNLELTK